MAAALLFGNLALSPEFTPPSVKRDLAAVVTAKASKELRCPESMAARTSKHFLKSHLASGGDGSHPPQRPLRRRPNGKPGPFAVYSFNPSSLSGDGGSEEDWEQELRNMLMDMEEMEVLKNHAEELQSRSTGDEEENGGDGKNESEEEKRERVRRELEKLAKDLAERRETGKLMFDLGQKAYGKGKYLKAVEFLEAALTIIPRPTLFGGEIQIWLAMAYDANKRHRDCIALYKQLEEKHPCANIRRQAAELRYILEAPKLKISRDEMVTIPLIVSSYDRYAVTWSDEYKDRDQRRKTDSTTGQLPSSKYSFGDFVLWQPYVELEKGPAFWTLFALCFGLLGTALLLQR